ncbi:MAG: hypothetical protein KGH63_00815 [Candidatus Micrarchaeota archaeon]|nr:hypothetical protein [Candidatus Micrarchaeota archaeon]
MRRILPVLLLLALSSILLAVSPQPLQLLQPTATVPDGGQVEYGSVGPGQTFIVQIDPVVTDANGVLLNQWYQAQAVNLPAGWTSRPSMVFQKPLQVEITPAPDALDGDYVVNLAVSQEAGHTELGGSETFSVLVHVKHDVLAMTVDPPSAEVGAGQPARFTITLTNTGSANDVFDVSSSGVAGWSFQKNVYLSAGASKSITYEVVGTDESDYHVTLSARSSSSSLIHQEQPVALTVRTNLLSDYRATSRGVLLFPILQAPMYALSGIISLFFPGA